MARLKIRYRLQAVDELEQAAEWYRAKNPRVTAQFLDAVKKKLLDILRHPHSWPADAANLRVALIEGFPYCIVFREHRSVVDVIAVAHTSREPDYWLRRIEE